MFKEKHERHLRDTKSEVEFLKLSYIVFKITSRLTDKMRKQYDKFILIMQSKGYIFFPNQI